MRLDKFLKVTRIIKRRTIAKEVCEKGRVLINDRKAKASTNVEIGDSLIIRLGNRVKTINVLGLSENSTKKDSSLLYDLIKDEKINEEKVTDEKF